RQPVSGKSDNLWQPPQMGGGEQETASYDHPSEMLKSAWDTENNRAKSNMQAASTGIYGLRVSSSPFGRGAMTGPVQYSIAFVSGVLVGLVGVVFCCLETQYSWPVISWKHSFENEITETGQVRLGDLVGFQWEWIYLLESYEPVNPNDNELIFAKTSVLHPYW